MGNKQDMSFFRILSVAVLAWALTSCNSSEDPAAVIEGWPKRPITISCLAAAGGGTDLVSRLMAKEMGEELGVKINVVNRTEGGGAAAINYVAQSARDGYNWGGFSDSVLTKCVLGTSETTAKDWACFIVAGAPGVISVRPDSPYQNIEQLVAAAKANPRTIKAGASIVGCIWHAKLLALERAADVSFQFLPFPGSHPSQLATISGELDVVLTSISEQADLIEGGKLRPLAMIEMDSFEFPKGKTIPAAGAIYPKIADVPVNQFLGIALPSDTPAPILAKITDAFKKVIQRPSVVDYVASRHLTLMGHHGEEATKKNQVAESVWTWTLHDLGIAVKSPETFGIPKP